MRTPLAAGLIVLAMSCHTQRESRSELITVQPSRIVDLGALINEDTTYRFWGEQQLRASGLDQLNVFEDREIHHAFLTRDILIYEQLANLDELLGSEQLQFVGVPLNVEDGNGVPVRPVVFVFDKNDV